MIIHTTAEGITLAKRLENQAAGFYEDLSSKYPTGSETFLSMAKDCRKYINQIETAYYSVISDAIEGCFALNLDTNKYLLDTSLDAGAGFPDAVKAAIDMEEMLVNFYTEAAAQCQAVMADVPRVMTLIAQKRKKRRADLEALLL